MDIYRHVVAEEHERHTFVLGDLLTPKPRRIRSAARPRDLGEDNAREEQVGKINVTESTTFKDDEVLVETAENLVYEVMIRLMVRRLAKFPP